MGAEIKPYKTLHLGCYIMLHNATFAPMQNMAFYLLHNTTFPPTQKYQKTSYFKNGYGSMSQGDMIII